MVLAHALTDDDCGFLDVDESFCDLLQMPKGELIGRNLLDITHPHDRTGNHGKLDRLLRDGTPFRITKRYLRPSASSAWVENHVSRFRDGGTNRLVASVRKLDEPEAAIMGRSAATPRLSGAAPGVTSAIGARFRAIQRERLRSRAHLPAELIGTPAYDMLLELAASDAEGRPADCRALCAVAAIPSTTGARWLERLVKLGLVESRSDANPGAGRWVVELSDAGRCAMTRTIEDSEGVPTG